MGGGKKGRREEWEEGRMGGGKKGRREEGEEGRRGGCRNMRREREGTEVRRQRKGSSTIAVFLVNQMVGLTR